MSKLVKLIIAAIVVVAVGVGAWFAFLRDDPAPEFSLGSERTTSTTGGDAAASSTTPTTADAPLDGAWVASVPEDGGAGYRIEEVLSGLNTTATARTADVTGSMTIAQGSVSATEITVDMTTLRSTDKTPGNERRDALMKGIGLETDRFAKATFELTGPIALDAPTQGAQLEVDATGRLTLHGVTKDVTIPLQARWNQDGTIDVVGSLEISLPDYGITPPDLGFVKVESTGTLEFKLLFTRKG